MDFLRHRVYKISSYRRKGLMLKINFVNLIILSLAFAMGCSQKDLGERFANDAGFNKASQTSYNLLLKKYVDEAGFVKYSEWKQNKEDEAALSTVVDGMINTNINRLSDEELLAFYINAYNALTIDLILKNYSKTMGDENSPYPNVRSIRNINNLDDKVWDEFTWKIPHFFTNEGGLPKEVSLNQIEKTILNSFRDARIHFAINCASVGCPPLLAESYTAENLENQLFDVAYRFVNDGIHSIIDKSDPEFLLIETSQIMDWYAQDFVNDETGDYSDVRTFFASYIDTERTGIESEALLECVEFTENNECLFFKWEIFPSLDYDWTLNESANKASLKGQE